MAKSTHAKMSQSLEELLTGMTLSNRYVILNKHSHGKFGMVYLAKDTKNNDRKVIVKISKKDKHMRDEYETLC